MECLISRRRSVSELKNSVVDDAAILGLLSISNQAASVGRLLNLTSNMFKAVCFALLAMAVHQLLKLWKNKQTVRYRHGSFVPVRSGGKAKWFVDGKDYMSTVADAIDSAEKEILITDWQMSPYVFLKRNSTGVQSLDWRLDKMLLRKADEGVRVYILLYWETKLTMDLGSEHVVSVLNDHENISVDRHPDWLTLITNPCTLFRWSHHEKMVIVDRSVAFVGGIDLCYGRWDTPSHELLDPYPNHPCLNKNEECAGNSNDRYSLWPGKDYCNTFYDTASTIMDNLKAWVSKESESTWDEPLKDYSYVNRSEVPRMPWHDVACAFTGLPVLDAVEHFIQRYNALRPWWTFPPKFPSSYPKVESEKTLGSDAYDNVSIQILRSVDDWSAGQPHESSIYNAYLDAIENSKHFIYIENQFFISSQEGFWIKVQNKIQSALVDRIARAYEHSEDFHVMVFTPLKPEFPGEWDSPGGENIRAVSRWNYATICHGNHSLFHRLLERNVPKNRILEYFSVYSLRTHGVINDKVVTEIIYVHSKVMIVDDRIAIVGSANINDRSMLGGRDSEVAVMIQDIETIDGRMNGEPFQVGKFSHSLRCRLLKEHLGLLGKECDVFEISEEDPLLPSFIRSVRNRAAKNTKIYDDVFHQKLFPKDGVDNFHDMRAKQERPRQDSSAANEQIGEVKGNIVTYACSFLKEELKPSYLDLLHLPMVLDRPNRFNASTPVRNDNLATWFIKSSEYTSALADVIESATQEILITDWQIYPHVRRKRRDISSSSLRWRLHKLLTRKADQGVRVYILLSWDTNFVKDLRSDHPFLSLNKHENIEVTIRGLYHERMVVVDGSIAFIGGIDLCYEHREVRDYESQDVGQSGSLDSRTFVNDGRPIDETPAPIMTCELVGYALFGSTVWDAAVRFTHTYNRLNARRESPPKSPRSPYIAARSDPSFVSLAAAYAKATVQSLFDKFSVENAYLHVIKNANHFIYIETVFFTSSEGTWLETAPRILSTLADRIMRAHETGEDFHVLFFAEEAKPELSIINRNSLHILKEWNYNLIRRLENSLFKALLERNISRESATKYFSLCTSEEIVTDIVFINSDTIIADDRAAVVGRRDVMGDSEVAAWIIEDIEMVSGRMNGKHFRVGKFSHSLRCCLLEKRLGYLNKESFSVEDPLTYSFLREEQSRSGTVGNIGCLV